VAVLVVLLGAGVASVPGWYWWQWRAEQRVIADLGTMGATVEARRFEPRGLARYLPARWAFLSDRVVQVRLSKRTADDLRRVNLGALAELQELRIVDSVVGGEAFERLRGLKHLRRLTLDRDTFDFACLGQLSACRELEFLSLRSVALTDAGVAEVGQITTLHRLDLGVNVAVTDAGIARLAGLTSIEWLDVSYTGLTDAGLRHLRAMKSLHGIEAEHTQLTLEGMSELRRVGVR
jgi:hypothetical protein